MNVLHPGKEKVGGLPPIQGVGGRPKILVTSDLGEEATAKLEQFADVILDKKLEKDQDRLPEALQGVDAIIVRGAIKMTADVIEKADNLKMIGRLGIGLDNIDLKAAEERGIKVVNSSGCQEISDSVCEAAMFALGGLVRNIPAAHESTLEGRWEKKKFASTALGDGTLAGKTMGIIGYAGIGQTMAKLAQAFGMNVVVHTPSRKSIDEAQGWLFEDAKPDLRDHDTLPEGTKYAELDTLLAESDVVSLHIPLIKGEGGTENLIGKGELESMKPSAILVNFGRGGIVDEDALLKALKEGDIAGAVLDTFVEEKVGAGFIESLRDDELGDKVVLTPHIGSQTPHAQNGAARIIVDHFENFFRQRDVQTG